MWDLIAAALAKDSDGQLSDKAAVVPAAVAAEAAHVAGA